MVAPNEQPQLVDLIGDLLAEQGRLQTPVALASRAYDQSRIGNPKSKILPSLIPLTAPAAGEQYAFEVNLDQCTGCKACVAACHSLNGLDDTEAWRDVGLITGFKDDGSAYQQTVTTACHHCADPGCLNGCPVLAYEKDPVTGIVRHLDDQCIGCQYCILKCPYDVPKYNERLGIVRKCDMCHQRLTAGEAPACVQACPTHAIRIVNVTVDTGFRSADTSQFLSVAPDPSLTEPTTHYVSARGVPANAAAADAGAPRVQPAHTPLAIMLVLTQLALGVQAVSLFVTIYATNPQGIAAGLSPAALLTAAAASLAAGLAASVAHLGQPLRAWRVFLGVRTSWLSREAIVFGLWFGALATVAPVTWFFPEAVELLRILNLAALLVGCAGVVCSAMVYADTGRRGWNAPVVFTRFGGTAAVGAALAISPATGFGVLGIKLSIELLLFLRGPSESRSLAAGPLNRAFRMRFFLGGFALAMLGAAATGSTGAWPVAVVFAVAGELSERGLFFRAIDGSRMPGVGSA